MQQGNCEHCETGEEVQATQKISERFSSIHHPKQDPATSASTAAHYSVPLHIYENICCASNTASSSYSARNVQDEHYANCRILPPIISERPADGSLRNHTNKERCTSKVSACHSGSCCDSTESRSRSHIWFGLDISGTV